MATVFSTATLRLNVEAQPLLTGMSTAKTRVVSAVDDMRESAEAFEARWKDLTGGLKETKRIISGILISQGFYALSSALLTTSSAALEFSREMETASVSLEYFVNATAGTEEAAARVSAYLREVNEFAANTPFDTDQVLALSKYMQAVGVSINNTQSVLSVITDTAAATGAGTEQLQRITFALGQMITKGRIANEEIRQLANANIPIYDILQEELKLTGEEISNIGKHWVSADRAVVAILRGLEKRYDGAADRIAETFDGLTDTIIDDTKIIANIAFEAPYKSMTKAAAGLRDILDELREVATEKGAPGLFNDLVLKIDPSGELGNSLLQMTGNIRNVTKALSELSHVAVPVLNVFHESFVATFTLGTQTITGFAKFVTGTTNGVERLGVSIKVLGRVAAAAFITFKATKYVSLFGQYVAEAFVSTKAFAQGLLNVVPASMAAQQSLLGVTAGVAGVVAQLVAAVSLFSTLRRSMAGLSSEDGASGLVSSWENAYTAYAEKMDAYNAAIEEYRKEYREDYSTLESGKGDRGSLTEAPDKKKGKGGSKGKGKDEWIASFDEVFVVPKDDKTAAYQTEVKKDLADILGLMDKRFVFPTTTNIPEKPEFSLDDVFGPSLWDKTGNQMHDMVSKVLPAAVVLATTGLGKVFARSFLKPKKLHDPTDTVAGLKLGHHFLSAEDASKMASKLNVDFSKHYVAFEDSLHKLELDGKQASRLNTDEAWAKYKGSLDTANKQLDDLKAEWNKLDELNALAGKGSTELRSIRKMQEDLDMHQVTYLRKERAEIASKLADPSLSTHAFDSYSQQLTSIDKQIHKLTAHTGSTAIAEATAPDILHKLDSSSNKLIDIFNDTFKLTPDATLDAHTYDIAAIRKAADAFEEWSQWADAYEKRLAQGVSFDRTQGTMYTDILRLFRGEIKTNLQSLLDNAALVNNWVAAKRGASIIAPDLIAQATQQAFSMFESEKYMQQTARLLDAIDPKKTTNELLDNFLTTGDLFGEHFLTSLREMFKKTSDETDAAEHIRSIIKEASSAERAAVQTNVNRYISEHGLRELSNEDLVKAIAANDMRAKAAEKQVHHLEQSLARSNLPDAKRFALHERLSAATRAQQEAETTKNWLTDRLQHRPSSTTGMHPIDELLTLGKSDYDLAVSAMDAGIHPYQANVEEFAFDKRTLDALQKLGLEAKDLWATGTKTQNMANGLDAFSGSLSSLSHSLFGTPLRDMTSDFVKETANLGVTFEPLVRYTIAQEMARAGIGKVGGTGNVAAMRNPLVVQNDASIRLIDMLNPMVNGAVNYGQELSLDIKTTGRNVVDTLLSTSHETRNGLHVISAEALKAANRPAWYYQFASQTAAFRHGDEMVMSVLNRDFSLAEEMPELLEKFEHLLQGKADTATIRNLEGRLFSAEAVKTYGITKGKTDLPFEELTKEYTQEVIFKLMPHPTELFDTGLFDKAITSFIVDYSNSSFKGADALSLSKSFTAQNELLALLKASGQDIEPFMHSYMYIKDKELGTGRSIRKYMPVNFDEVPRQYTPFGKSESRWFKSILGEQALDGVSLQGAFKGAEVKGYIDELVRTYNRELATAVDPTAVTEKFVKSMQKLSDQAMKLAVGDNIFEAAAKFGAAATNTVKYADALITLADATDTIAKHPQIVQELPRLLRTVIDQTNRYNAALSTNAALSRAQVAGLKHNYVKLVEMLGLESDKDAYDAGQKISQVLATFDGREDKLLQLSSEAAAEKYMVDLPFGVADATESLHLFANEVSAAADSGLINLASDVQAADFRAAYTAYKAALEEYEAADESLAKLITAKNTLTEKIKRGQAHAAQLEADPRYGLLDTVPKPSKGRYKYTLTHKEVPNSTLSYLQDVYSTDKAAVQHELSLLEVERKIKAVEAVKKDAEGAKSLAYDEFRKTQQGSSLPSSARDKIVREVNELGGNYAAASKQAAKDAETASLSFKHISELLTNSKENLSMTNRAQRSAHTAAFRKQAVSYLDIETTGMPVVDTAGNMIPPKVVQISARNQLGIAKEFWVNWGEDNKAILAEMRGISSDFEKVYTEAKHLDDMNNGMNLQDTLKAVYEFVNGDTVPVSAYNGSNIGGFDLTILNSLMPKDMQFKPGPDIMRWLTQEIESFTGYSKTMTLAEAVKLVSDRIEAFASIGEFHNASNDVEATVRVAEALKSGFVAKVAKQASNSNTDNIIQAMQTVVEGLQEKAAQEILNKTGASAESIEAALKTADSTKQYLDGKSLASEEVVESIKRTIAEYASNPEAATSEIFKKNLSEAMPVLTRQLETLDTNVHKSVELIAKIADPKRQKEAIKQLDTLILARNRDREILSWANQFLPTENRKVLAGDEVIDIEAVHKAIAAGVPSNPVNIEGMQAVLPAADDFSEAIPKHIPSSDFAKAMYGLDDTKKGHFLSFYGLHKPKVPTVANLSDALAGLDKAASIKNIVAEGSGSSKVVANSIYEGAYNNALRSMIVTTRKGLDDAKKLGIASLLEAMSSTDKTVAVFFDKASKGIKTFGASLEVDGDDIIKSLKAMAEAGDFGDEVGKELTEKIDDVVDVLRQAADKPSALKSAIGYLSDNARKALSDFAKGSVIYKTADDTLHAGTYAAKQVKKAAGMIDDSFVSIGKKIATGEVAGYGILDAFDIFFTTLSNSKADKEAKKFTESLVQGTLSDESLSVLSEAGVKLTDIVANNMFKGTGSAFIESTVSNGISNVLASVISGAVAGIPGMVLGGAAAIGSSILVNKVNGDSGSMSRYYDDLREQLTKRDAESEGRLTNMLRDQGYTEEKIQKLVVDSRLIDLDELLDKLGSSSANDAQKVSTLVDTINAGASSTGYLFATRASSKDSWKDKAEMEAILNGRPYVSPYAGGVTSEANSYIANMTSSVTDILPLRLAAALKNDDSIRSDKNNTLLVKAGTDLREIKGLLNDTQVKLGAEVKIAGETYQHVLNGQGQTIRFYDNDLETLRLIATGVYKGSALTGEYAEAIKTAVASSPELLSMLSDQGISTYMASVLNELGSVLEAYNTHTGSSLSVADLEADSTLKEAVLQQGALFLQSFDELKRGEAALLADMLKSGEKANTQLTEGSLSGATNEALEELRAVGINLSERLIETSAGSQSVVVAETIASTLNDRLRGVKIAGLTLDDVTITTEQARILAEAGIVINSDGTATFMKAGTAGSSGAERTFDVASQKIAQDDVEAASRVGMNINTAAGTLSFGDFSAVKEQMTAAYKALPTELAGSLVANGQIAEPVQQLVSSLGRITDEGILEITNRAILTGQTKMSDVLNSLDWTGVSDELQSELRGIAELFDGELTLQGERVTGNLQDNLISWADGIVVPAPYDSLDQITDNAMSLYNQAHVHFKETADGLQMIITDTSELLANGVSVLSKQAFATLGGKADGTLEEGSIAKLLEDIGVKFKAGTQSVLVDLSDIMKGSARDIVSSFVDQPELWQSLPEPLRNALGQMKIQSAGELLEIQTSTDQSLIKMGEGWITAWSALPESAQRALDGVVTGTASSMLTLHGYLEGSDIPETVDRALLIPFKELPIELQAELSAADETADKKLYELKTTTEGQCALVSDALSGLAEDAGTSAGAIGESASTIEGSISTMAKNIADAIIDAQMQLKGLQDLKPDKSGGFFGTGIGGTKNTQLHTRGSDGNMYVKEVDAAGNAVRYTRIDKNGRAVDIEAGQLPAGIKFKAKGGTTAGLTLAGELGEELAVLPNGLTTTVDAGLYDFPAGTQIINAQDTAAIKKYAGENIQVQKYAAGTYGARNFMPANTYQLSAALGMKNAGIGQEASSAGSIISGLQHALKLSSDTINNLASSIANRIYEFLAPLFATLNETEQNKVMAYVGTLIADDEGLRELERSLGAIRVAEGRRS